MSYQLCIAEKDGKDAHSIISRVTSVWQKSQQRPSAAHTESYVSLFKTDNRTRQNLSERFGRVDPPRSSGGFGKNVSTPRGEQRPFGESSVVAIAGTAPTPRTTNVREFQEDVGREPELPTQRHEDTNDQEWDLTLADGLQQNNNYIEGGAQIHKQCELRQYSTRKEEAAGCGKTATRTCEKPQQGENRSDIKMLVQYLEDMIKKYAKDLEMRTRDDMKKKEVIINSELADLLHREAVKLENMREQAEIFVKRSVEKCRGTSPGLVEFDAVETNITTGFSSIYSYIENMACEMESLRARCQHLENVHAEDTQRLLDKDKDLSKCMVLINDYDNQNKALQESMKTLANNILETERSIEALMENYDSSEKLRSLEAMITRMKEAEEVKESEEQSILMKIKGYHQQLRNLLEEISTNPVDFSNLNNSNSFKFHVTEKLRTDLNRLKHETAWELKQLFERTSLFLSDKNLKENSLAAPCKITAALKYPLDVFQNAEGRTPRGVSHQTGVRNLNMTSHRSLTFEIY